MPDFETAPVGTTAELDRVKRENDTREAHVERLHRALDNVLHEVGTHSHDDLSDDERAALAALSETPATSLAHRDMLKQAEALEEAAADTVPAMHKMKHWLLNRANDLRQNGDPDDKDKQR